LSIPYVCIVFMSMVLYWGRGGEKCLMSPLGFAPALDRLRFVVAIGPSTWETRKLC